MKLSSGVLIITALTLVTSGCGEKTEPQKETEEAKTMEQPVTNSKSDRPLAQIPATQRADHYDAEPATVIDNSKTYIATIHTEKGNIVMELDTYYAPLHTNNFVFLAQQGFYDGLTFHRVEPGFVIQGGDPLGQGNGGPGYQIPAEIGLPHDQGVVAMARQGNQINPEKKSSGSQFYITLAQTSFLDGEYSVFGKVIQGFDVVQQIAIGDIMTRVDVEEK